MPLRRRRFAGLALCVFWAALVQGCATPPPPTDVELGEMALAAGEWRKARNHFAIALKKDPRAGRALLGQARAHVAGRDPEAALRSIKILSQVDPNRFKAEGHSTYADALHGAGSSRLANKQSQAALVAVRMLARLEPQRPGLNRLLGDAILAEAVRLRLRGDPNAAFALYREASQVAPQRLEGWLGAAEIMIEANRGKDAVRYLEAARKFHPTSGEIRMLSIQAISSR